MRGKGEGVGLRAFAARRDGESAEHRRAALVVGIPAAAAAVVLGVLIAQPDDGVVVVQRAAIPANVVSVDVKAGQHATVLKTSDPKVTVVWISPGGSE